jgi:trans-2,3-dihydro-3-hydroxyanthranilate isomerase
MTIKFHIVDVFSKGRYSGNQLAVFENARHLSTEEMQKIAKEVNFSETTFILDHKERAGAWDGT